MVCFRSKEDRRRKIQQKDEVERSNDIGSGKIQIFRIYNEDQWKGKRTDQGVIKKKRHVVLKQVWRLGKRRFMDDFEKRMILFKYLVLEVIMYGQKCGIEKREKSQRRECKRDT